MDDSGDQRIELAGHDHPLLKAVTDADKCICETGLGPAVYQGLLDALLRASQSELGLVVRGGDARRDAALVSSCTSPYVPVEVGALSSAWLDALFAEAPTTVGARIYNDAADVSGLGRLVFGTPLRHMATMPLRVAGETFGMVVIARQHRYDVEPFSAWEPLLAAMASALYTADLEAQRADLEQELRIREERWNYALSGSGEGVFDWDIQNDTICLSHQWKSMLGYADEPLDDAVSTWSGRLHPDDAAGARAVVDAYLSGRLTHYENEYRLRHRDGSWRWILARGKVVAWTGDGKPSRFVGTQVDITERKVEHGQLVEARDAAVHSAKARADFLAVMTHELRTPLSAVIGMASLLGDTNLDESQREYVSMLRKAGDALLAIVNNILELSKLDAGKVELEKRPYDARELAMDVLQLMKPRAREKGLLLRFQGPKDSLWVLGDPHRVRQILLNLVGNAVKFTDAGFVSVELLLPSVNPGCILLRVEDTGIGIPESKHGQVFEAFTQVDSSISRKFGGTGLGLAICKQLADLMSGEITLRTRPGGGTIFDVIVPAPACRAPDLARASLRSVESTIEAQLRERQPRVLVAEDDAVNRKVVQTFLERLGATVDCVKDGLGAVEAVRHSAYDVVFMDCHMPTLDGFEATRQIRGLPQKSCNVPIVALTADAFDEARKRCVEAGMNEFLTKPVQRSALRAILYRLVCRTAEAAG